MVDNNRRRILKGTSAIAGASMLSAIPSKAQARSKPPAAEELGLSSDIKESLKNGRYQKAKSILEKHNVPHSLEEKSYPVEKSDKTDSSTKMIEDKNDHCNIYKMAKDDRLTNRPYCANGEDY